MNKKEQSTVLSRTETISNMIADRFEQGCKNVHHAALTAARSYHSTLLFKIPSWIDDIECANTVGNIFKVKSQSQAYTEEIVEKLRERIKDDATEWAGKRFAPLLENELNTLACTVNTDTQRCYDELKKLLENNLGNKVFSTVIPYSNIIRNSIIYKMTAYEYMHWLGPAKKYVELCEEIIRKVG